ncbi:MAG: hypothetical protein O3C27_14520 [Actinomycetota bacterium]|nr:hypothetical protein [Actinomycetota bacterium]
MAELGGKSMHTMMDEPDARYYPSLYLSDADARAAVPSDAQPGDERLITGKVRISGITKGKAGAMSAELEIIELNIAADDSKADSAAKRAYPTMVGG